MAKILGYKGHSSVHALLKELEQEGHVEHVARKWRAVIQPEIKTPTKTDSNHQP